MAASSSRQKGWSPLSIIALFLSFSETVLGIAVMQTTGVIQIALTTFVIAFPLVVSGVFFLILWKKNYVFYPPTEFGRNIDVGAYVQAMQSRQPPQAPIVTDGAIQSIEAKITSISEMLANTSDPKEQAALVLREAVEAVRESVIRIDSHPLFGEAGRVWEEPFESSGELWAFLDRLWFELRRQNPIIPAFTYGDTWAMRTKGGKWILPAGKVWAERNGTDEDRRTLREVGLTGGIDVDIVSPR